MDTIERRIEILERRLFGTDNSFEPRRSTIVADLDRIRRMLADKASIVSRLPIDQLQQMQSIRTTSNQPSIADQLALLPLSTQFKLLETNAPTMMTRVDMLAQIDQMAAPVLDSAALKSVPQLAPTLAHLIAHHADQMALAQSCEMQLNEYVKMYSETMHNVITQLADWDAIVGAEEEEGTKR